MDIQNSPVALFILLATVITSLAGFYGYINLNRWMLNPYLTLRKKQFDRIVSSGLVHADFTHLLFNMLSFYFFAFYLEQLMVRISGNVGHFYFGAIYFASMIIANIPTLIKHRNNYNYNSLGASGAVSGMIFSLIFFAPASKIYLYFIIGMPAILFAVLYIAFSIYLSRNKRDNINHEAHLWGAISGFILTFFFYPDYLQSFFYQVTNLLNF
jgi:membrane associated rhomboid family serine protease